MDSGLLVEIIEDTSLLCVQPYENIRKMLRCWDLRILFAKTLCYIWLANYSLVKSPLSTPQSTFI